MMLTAEKRKTGNLLVAASAKKAATSGAQEDIRTEIKTEIWTEIGTAIEIETLTEIESGEDTTMVMATEGGTTKAATITTTMTTLGPITTMQNTGEIPSPTAEVSSPS